MAMPARNNWRSRSDGFWDMIPLSGRIMLPTPWPWPSRDCSGMIAYLEGTLLKKRENRVVLLANHIGYEILLPTVVLETIGEKREGDFVFFYIYHHQTERQPRPVLIGFNSEAEKEFFQMLISV